ncbi:MAG: hypothetical protein RDV48_09065 [Candidatus Eremiobacteraeota bacterium]|nr:hypothetical protein [Candidatus Eremiobacteraeota bacterium]
MHKEETMAEGGRLQKLLNERRLAVEAAYSGFRHFYWREVLSPARDLIDGALGEYRTGRESFQAEQRELWDRLQDSARQRRKALGSSFMERAHAMERDLTGYEEKLDYLDASALVNSALKEREESLRLRRDVLNRELFTLRARYSAMRPLFSLKASLLLKIRIDEKEKAIKEVLRALDEVRSQWELERRGALLAHPSKKELWKKRTVAMAHLRGLSECLAREGEHGVEREAMYAFLSRPGKDVLSPYRHALSPYCAMLEAHERICRQAEQLIEELDGLGIALDERMDDVSRGVEVSEASGFFAALSAFIEALSEGQAPQGPEGILEAFFASRQQFMARRGDILFPPHRNQGEP